MCLLRLVWAVVRALFVKRADLVAENLVLRQQIIVFNRKAKRPRAAGEGTYLLALAGSVLGWMARKPHRRQARDRRPHSPRRQGSAELGLHANPRRFG